MQTAGQLHKLVRDALANKYMTRSGCFWSNASCEQLREVGVPALPTIEAVVLSEVGSFYHCPTESLESKFPGLLSLLVTYFAIGKDTRSDRIFPLFSRLSGSPRVLAMRAINIVWLCRAPTCPLPDQLVATLTELAEGGTGQVQQVARWLLDANQAAQQTAEEKLREEGERRHIEANYTRVYRELIEAKSLAKHSAKLSELERQEVQAEIERLKTELHQWQVQGDVPPIT